MAATTQVRLLVWSFKSSWILPNVTCVAHTHRQPHASGRGADIVSVQSHGAGRGRGCLRMRLYTYTDNAPKDFMPSSAPLNGLEPIGPRSLAATDRPTKFGCHSCVHALKTEITPRTSQIHHGLAGGRTFAAAVRFAKRNTRSVPLTDAGGSTSACAGFALLLVHYRQGRVSS